MTPAEPSTLSVLINAAGGLGIFLLGMQQLSDGLQAVAGRRVRKMIAAVTDNRFLGIATGATVTGIVQASSIVTVMAVGFVTAGIMTLNQAINVIIGANIGTTVTAWIVAVAPIGIGKHAMVIIAISCFFYLFSKKEKIRYTGLAFLGLGLIFFSLDLMVKGLQPLTANESFQACFAMLHADTYWGVIKCVLVGAIATAAVQSSSATTAISITLAVNGAISFETAGALVFGMNIGTTITAWLAALNATTEAKRVAMAHTLFNLIGVIIMAPLFVDVIAPIFHYYYPHMDKVTVMDNGVSLKLAVAAPIAMMHTAFNIINTCFFIPFVGPFATLIRKLIPDSTVAEIPHLSIADSAKISPVLAVEQARKQVEYMADCNSIILSEFRTILAGEQSEDLEQHIFNTEDKLDRIQHEVSIFLGKVMTMKMPNETAQRARMLLRVADEFESVSDEVVSLLKVVKRMRSNEMKLSEKGLKEMLGLHDRCAQFAQTVSDAFRLGKSRAPDVLRHIRVDAQTIRTDIKDIRASQLERLTENAASAESMKIVTLMDMINNYRRMKETCLNIGEAILEEADVPLTQVER